MEVLEKIFRESYPVFRRRCELIHLKPNKGEKFSSYMLRLIEMSEECDLHELTHEDFILLVATIHCNRDELRRGIKRVRQPTWIEIEAMVEDYKRSMIGEESQKANQVQKSPRKPQARDQKQRIPKELQSKCFKCLKEGYKAGKCRLSPDSKCTSCGRLGHIAKACISSRMNKKQNSPPAHAAKEVKKGKPDATDADDEKRGHGKGKSSSGTPDHEERRITRHTLRVMATADTGCSVNLLALLIAEENKLTHTTRGLPRLVTATGADMTVNGQANITVSSSTQLTQLNILISSDLDEDMLLGLKSLKEMDRIPQGFPNYVLDRNIELGTASCCMTRTENSMIQLMIQKFKNTISDDLNPKPMKGDKMRINLKPNVEPKKVMPARRVPLRYETEAD